jgi:hypothetical protein
MRFGFWFVSKRWRRGLQWYPFKSKYYRTRFWMLALGPSPSGRLRSISSSATERTDEMAGRRAAFPSFDQILAEIRREVNAGQWRLIGIAPDEPQKLLEAGQRGCPETPADSQRDTRALEPGQRQGGG